ncbi:glycosyl transferase family 1 [Oleiagrimonas soli]|nr:glycosyl transferase family 1 [Oleiagrimonas soli]
MMACVLLMLALMSLAAVANAAQDAPQRILFIGNSFTYGAHSPVWRYRADTVHDLNGDGVGGVPALFKLFTEEAGLHYDVSLETDAGQTLKFHFEHRADRFDRAWDHVVMQEYSTLSPTQPGDPRNFQRYADKLAALFHARNPKVDIRLLATWSRPDQTYRKGGHWHGQPIQAMGRDLYAAYRQVADGNPAIDGVIPLGLAFNRAIAMGVADPNPYDGIAFGQIDLWAYDHYHASTYGYYLEALMDFGAITGKDPRMLGRDEKAARELGISPDQAHALQTVAQRQLHLEALRNPK